MRAVVCCRQQPDALRVIDHICGDRRALLVIQALAGEDAGTEFLDAGGAGGGLFGGGDLVEVALLAAGVRAAKPFCSAGPASRRACSSCGTASGAAGRGLTFAPAFSSSMACSMKARMSGRWRVISARERKRSWRGLQRACPLDKTKSHRNNELSRMASYGLPAPAGLVWNRREPFANLS